MSISAVDERVTDEIEALQAILLDDELVITENENGEPETVEVLVFPSTAEDSDSQYVCVKLVVKLSPGYPDVSPPVSLRNPRGLDEDHVRQIESEAVAKCEECAGQPIMFELIQLVREHLTRNNFPSGKCMVCLYGFCEGDSFTKTECYHHFHSRCLAAHVDAAEKYYKEEQEKLPQWQQDSRNIFQALCPVCRESINCDVENLWLAPPPIQVDAASDFSVTEELKELQRKMAELFLKQQEKGGIIDPEAEGVKMLVRTEDNQTESTAERESTNSLASSSLNVLPRQNVLKMDPNQHKQGQPNHSQNHPRYNRHGQGHRNNRQGHHHPRGGRGGGTRHPRRSNVEGLKQAEEGPNPR